MKNSTIKDYFIGDLKNNSTVSKEDILNLALECGIDVKSRVAKVKIVDMIIEHGHYDKLYEFFNEFITIPVWDVADYYSTSTSKINKLREIGFIKEEPTQKEFYSRRDKQYFNADIYPLSVLNYDKEELKKAHDNAFGGNTYELRIETKANEEVKELINILGKVFKIDKAPTTYQHRNNDGQYTYFKVRLLNNTKEEENALLAEIRELKENHKVAHEKLKKENQKQIDKILNLLRVYLGEDLDIFNLTSKLESVVKNEEVCKLNNIPIKNSRNAGRKPKFDNKKITEMEIMKENGYSYNQIAEEYDTTKATVIKYLKHKKNVTIKGNIVKDIDN